MSQLASLVANHRVVVCVGSGGVGKTTSTAALGLWGALQGRRTAVLTIDPAKRLADCFGLSPTGHAIAPAVFSRYGLHPSGTLTALVVEQRGAWRAAIERYVVDPDLRGAIFRNRFYQGLSQTFTGSHEYMALNTLADLVDSDAYDLIVVDTPPTRQALNFLEAPRQLHDLLTHHTVQSLLRSSGAGTAWSAAQRTRSAVMRQIEHLTGLSAFTEMAAFFTDVGRMFGDFGARFTRMRAVLESADTAFVLVTSPEQEVLTEAHDLHTSLEQAGMTVRAVVVNRVHPAWPDGPKLPATAPPLARRLQKTLSRPSRQPPPLDWLAENFLAYQTRARGEQHRLVQFGQQLPTSLSAPLHIPALPAFVADLDGLVRLHAYLFGEDS